MSAFLLEKITKSFKEIQTNDFFRNIVTMVTGTGLSQLLPIVIIPLISRLYHPSDYAVLATYASLTALLSSISTGMYNYAIILDRNDEDACNTVGAAGLVLLLTSAFSILIIIIFKRHVLSFWGNSNGAVWFNLIPLTIFFQGSSQVLYSWNTRMQRYKRLSFNKVAVTTITSFSTLALGYWGARETGLIFSQVIGQIVSFILLLVPILKNDYRTLRLMSRLGLAQSFRRHIDFPKYNMPQVFVDNFKEISLVWMLSNFFNPVVLGSFSFARTVVFGPLQIIGSAVGEVFYQKASRIYNENGDLYVFSKKTVFNLLLIGLPAFIVILIWGDKLFGLLFSNKWELAGGFSQILILWLYIRFVGSPISTIPLILKKQRLFLIIGFLINFIPIVIFFCSAKIGLSISVALSFFSLSSFIGILLLILWIFSVINSKELRFINR